VSDTPSVTVAIPVLNEEAHLRECLDAVAAQTYANVAEILVVDGGSIDRTREIALSFPGVGVVSNPERIQAAGLNLALSRAKGDVFVRVDGHTVIETDYVERCVDALLRTGASYVGGSMVPVGTSGPERGIAVAMTSRLGVGPARFHHAGERGGWADTAYLGAFWTDEARAIGGYDGGKATNEDAEFAYRMGQRRGVWFDPTIRSRYQPRRDLLSLGRQFFRYGQGRAQTVRRHPRSLAPRQLAAPLLVLGLLSPWRRSVGAAYATVVLSRAALELRSDKRAAMTVAMCLPIMHLGWGVGFLSMMITGKRVRPSSELR